MTLLRIFELLLSLVGAVILSNLILNAIQAAKDVRNMYKNQFKDSLE